MSSSSDDLYAVLGVLPDAEDAVIKAAYRALSKLYHPDTWRGDAAEANRRMVAINEAYEVLGDASRRAAYDRSRHPDDQGDFSAAGTRDQDEAFASALADVEDRWKLACGIYPGLLQLRARLATFSSSLAFSFVSTLLDTKTYDQRVRMAHHMEQQFLHRYFGANHDVTEFAREVILHGDKDAARQLNRLLAVMGPKVDVRLLIGRVVDDYDLSWWSEKEATRRFRERLWMLDNVDAAAELAQHLGCTIKRGDGGWLQMHAVEVVTPDERTLTFKKGADFVGWAKANLCSD